MAWQKSNTCHGFPLSSDNGAHPLVNSRVYGYGLPQTEEEHALNEPQTPQTPPVLDDFRADATMFTSLVLERAAKVPIAGTV